MGVCALSLHDPAVIPPLLPPEGGRAPESSPPLLGFQNLSRWRARSARARALRAPETRPRGAGRGERTPAVTSRPTGAGGAYGARAETAGRGGERETSQGRYASCVDAGAYLRVSSNSQDVELQRSAIAKACDARGDRVVTWWQEKRTGKRLQRPELDAVRAAARAGDLRRLYVWRLDRLTRSGIRDTLDVVDELRRHGVELVTVADGFSLDGPAAEVVLAVVAWAAQMERLAIGERISEAREQARARGDGWGRPRRMTPHQQRSALAMAATGKTVREIAVALKVPRSTVWRALSQKPTKATGLKNALPRRL